MHITSKEHAGSKEQCSHMDHKTTVIPSCVCLPHRALHAAVAQSERQMRKLKLKMKMKMKLAVELHVCHMN